MLKLSESSSRSFLLFPCPLQESHASQHSPLVSVFTMDKGLWGAWTIGCCTTTFALALLIMQFIAVDSASNILRFRHIVNMYTALWPSMHWRASFSGRHLLWIISHTCGDKSKQGNDVLRISLTNKDFQNYKGSRTWLEYFSLIWILSLSTGEIRQPTIL